MKSRAFLAACIYISAAIMANSIYFPPVVPSSEIPSGGIDEPSEPVGDCGC